MYQALYRKWRPAFFDDVSGQPHVTQTLKNELMSGRISHAYLFTGSRGTGKTSCAKILSKAVNCLDPQNGNPCGKCEMCRAIDDGSMLDVVEIDAASNNGVDNIRDIREEVNFTPVRCKYRVYIIDEVHMLSPGAFNALLKTLEEPPSHVIFILATTEVHKLPATILSRCQRFDFKRISCEDISARLMLIAEGESVTLTEDAANLIARIADGGMRDAVSLLDRCCAKGSVIDSETVTAAAGIAGTRHLFSFSELIAKNDFSACISLVNTLHAEACDIESLCTELILHFRNLMLAKTVKDASSLIICSKAELEELKARSAEYKLSRLLDCLDILEETSAAVKLSANKKILLESAVIKMCSLQRPADSPADTPMVGALLSRIEALEARLASFEASAPARSQTPAAPAPAESATKASAAVTAPPVKKEEKPKPPAPEVKKPKPEPAAQPAAAAEQPSAKPEPAEPEKPVSDASYEFTMWPEVLELLKKNDLPLNAVLQNTTAFVSKGTHLVIRTDNPMLFRFIQMESHSEILRKCVYEVSGLKLRLAVKDSVPKEEKKADPLEDLKNKINIFNQNN